MEKVLIIGAVWVEPNSSAAGSRMLQLIKLFIEDNYEVTFATTTQKTTNAFNLTALGVIENSIELNSSSFDSFVKELNPSIVVFDRFMIEEQFGWRVADHCPNALRVLDTEDLHSLRKSRQEAIKKGKIFSYDDLLTSDVSKREIAAILRCDVSLIISSFEMELLQKVFKIDKKLLFYLPFLFEEISQKQINNWLPFEDRNYFATIGNFLHAPNVDAVLYLKKEIWPLIKDKIPNAEMHIYGAYPTQQILQLHNQQERFLIKGFVQDAEKVVSEAKVLLAPLRFGAGIKGKLSEAMLCGTPSVTSQVGAEGMHLDLPWNGFIKDEISAFVDKSIELYSNREIWEKAQQNGVKIINQLYNKSKLTPLFKSHIINLKHNLRKHRKDNFLGSLLQYQTMRSTKYMSKWIEEKNKN